MFVSPKEEGLKLFSAISVHFRRLVRRKLNSSVTLLSQNAVIDFVLDCGEVNYGRERIWKNKK